MILLPKLARDIPDKSAARQMIFLSNSFYSPIRVNDFPHHLNDAAAPFIVNQLIERPVKR